MALNFPVDQMLGFGDAISGIESGGNYSTLGPVTKSGDRAYGKYQVMGANIPQWTKQYYGQQLTPEQFVNSPEAQDAVFRGQFGQYVQKYGPEGAARAWFAGEGGMNNPNARDQLGTSVQSYGRRFIAGLGQQPSQQPSIPIQSPQGSPPQQVDTPNPPRLQSTPNSPALIGGSPNMALTNGGGYPMGGLPTQSPMTELYQFNQMQSAQPLINGQPDMARMQRQAQNLQNFKQLLARLGGYSFQG